MITQRLRITGRVQGVGFRYALQHEARRLGLAGWVRNRADGSVEAVARGPAQVVAALAEWAGRGPPAAHVTGLQIEDTQEQVPHGSFELRPTL
jgi:acylphosphatase